METRRAFLTGIRKFELQKAEIEPRPEQVLIKVAVCGLCHYELNHWKGLIGTFPQPVGHEVAGEVVATGSLATNLKAGDRVTTLFEPDEQCGFSDYLCVTAKHCVKLPPNVPMEEAVCEPVMCALNVIRQAKPEAGDHAVLVGCGCMGLWAAQLLKGNLLTTLTAIDFNEERLELAKQYGATHTINPGKEQVEERLEEITNGHLADFVIEGTGIPAVLNDCLRYLRPSGGGRLLMMSSHEQITKELDLREGVRKSAVLIVAHGGLSSDQHDDLRRTVELLAAGKVNTKDMITNRFKLEEIQKAFEALEHPPAGYLKGIIVPE